MQTDAMTTRNEAMTASRPNRWATAAAGVIMQAALGAVYEWSVFRNRLTEPFGYLVHQRGLLDDDDPCRLGDNLPIPVCTFTRAKRLAADASPRVPARLRPSTIDRPR